MATASPLGTLRLAIQRTAGLRSPASRAATITGMNTWHVKTVETLPDGKDYLSWMSDNVNAVQKAVEKVRG